MDTATSAYEPSPSVSREELDFQLLAPDQERDLLSFLENIQWHTPSPVHYDWLYQRNPDGRAVTWAAIGSRSGRILGCTSVFPRRMWIRGHEVLGSFGGNTFVHPRLRGRGVATEIHRVSRRDMPGCGVEFEYGLPNPPNARAMCKAGARIVGHLRRMHLPLRGSALAERIPSWAARLFSRPMDVAIRFYAGHQASRTLRSSSAFVPIDRFDERFDALVEDMRPASGLCGDRGRDFLEWRYLGLTSPLTMLAYEEDSILKGFAALELTRDRCYIFDFLCRDEPLVADALIAAIVRAAIDTGSHLLTFLANPTGPYADRFACFGFRLGAEHTMILKSPEDSPYHDVLHDFRNYFITPGDMDIETMSDSGPEESVAFQPGAQAGSDLDLAPLPQGR